MRPPIAPYRPLLDRLGFSASTLCAIHCAATPFLLSILPAIGLGFLANSFFELAMIGVSISIGAISLGSSWRHHRKWNALMMMASGGFLLLFNFFGHDTHSQLVETLHPWIAAFAGLMIASAHWINMRLCKTCHTCELDHTHEHIGHEHGGHEHSGHKHVEHEHIGHENIEHENIGHEHTELNQKAEINEELVTP